MPVPTAATSHASGSSRRYSVADGVAMMIPNVAAPSMPSNPRNNSQRPTIAPGDVPVSPPAVPCPPVAPVPTGDGATPTPKANEPAAEWPSTAETVRQATV